MSDEPNPEDVKDDGAPKGADDTPPPSGDKDAPADGSDKPRDQLMIPKSRLDEEAGKRKALEAEFAALAAELVNDLPERFRDLVPDGLSAADRVKWIRKAKASGAFNAVAVPQTDDRKPPKRDRDLQSMSARDRIAAGYGKKG